MFYKLALPLLLFLVNTLAIAQTNSYQQTLADAKLLIETGNINLAHLVLEKLSHSTHLSKIEKYKIYRYIAKAHIIELDNTNFRKYCEKAFQLVKTESPIYKAQYFSDLTAYYHNLTWGDSTVFYANKARKILLENKKDWGLVNIPFLYQMQGIARLYYRSTGTIKSKFDMPDSRNALFIYYDSAIYYSKKYPFAFRNDLANVHRAIGNRYLDMVSEYQYISKKQQKNLSKLSWYCFFQAKKNYEKAIQLTQIENQLEKFTNQALLGLNYMCIGERKKAKFIFDQNQQFLFKQSKTITSPKNILNGLTYARVNSFNLPYDSKFTNNTIKLLESTLPAYSDLLKYANTKLYDTYWISPYLQLYNHYARKYLYTRNKIDLIKATNYLITEKSMFNLVHDTITIKEYRQKNAQAELESIKDKKLKVRIINYINFTKKIVNSKQFPLLDCRQIQKKLRQNEGILLTHPCHVFLDDYKIYITKKNIFLLKSKENTLFNYLNIDTLDLKKFKKYAYEGYRDELYNVIKIHPKVKKIFTLYNDFNRYPIMINSSKGSTFKKLNYLSKQIEFCSIYSIPLFFNSNESKTNLKVDFIKLNSDTLSSLPYSWYFAKNFKYFPTTHSTYKGNIKQLLTRKGILHIIGHGSVKKYRTIGNMDQITLLNKSNSIDWGKIGDKKVKRDIVIYNNCESGLQTAYLNEYDKGLYLNLLYRGVKQVIVNPSKVDDNASAQIFNQFYKELKSGKTVNKAMYNAQKKYFIKSDHTHSHPMYWYPFKVISRH